MADLQTIALEGDIAKALLPLIETYGEGPVRAATKRVLGLKASYPPPAYEPAPAVNTAPPAPEKPKRPTVIDHEQIAKAKAEGKRVGETRPLIYDTDQGGKFEFHCILANDINTSLGRMESQGTLTTHIANKYRLYGKAEGYKAVSLKEMIGVAARLRRKAGRQQRDWRPETKARLKVALAKEASNE